MENSLSEIDWTQLVQIPSVSESFMQGLAHNPSIRWMDGQGGVAEGGTENAGEVDSDDWGCWGGAAESPWVCGRCRFLLFGQSVTKDLMCPGLFWTTFSLRLTRYHSCIKLYSTQLHLTLTYDLNSTKCNCIITLKPTLEDMTEVWRQELRFIHINKTENDESH